jgi:hypothetical protein
MTVSSRILRRFPSHDTEKGRAKIRRVKLVKQGMEKVAERTTMYKQFALLAAAQLTLAGSAWTQQNPIQWGDATAQKMSHFLPQPGAGLISRTPWGRQTDNQVAVSSGGTETQQYQDAVAQQLWFFDDPGLFQQVASAQKERADLDQARREDVKSHAAERNALQKQAWDLLKKGQTKESQALMEKIKAADAPYEAKKKELDDSVSTRRKLGRRLLVRILANFTLYDWSDPPAIPVGSLAGYPLYQANARASGNAPPEFISMAVYLGPPGFRNSSARNPELKVKCILVRVEVLSDAPHPETIKADEAVARQMLEKVDYATLAKLVQP